MAEPYPCRSHGFQGWQTAQSRNEKTGASLEKVMAFIGKISMRNQRREPLAGASIGGKPGIVPEMVVDEAASPSAALSGRS